MWKRFLTYIKETIQEEYKFIIFLILLYIIFQYPVNYYVIVGGGISNVNSRIKVDDSYSSKGSFNISYVTQLEGTLLSYGLSYLIPSWERESADNYKYVTNESIKDIEFRSDLDLKVANSTATYWAYHLANKKVNEDSSKLYVIAVFSPDKTSLKVRDQILSIDGHTFDSQKEAEYYTQLKLRLQAKDIKGFCLQPTFILAPGLKYKADFIVFNNDQTYDVIDVKGFKTKEYIAKKKVFEDKYNLKITEIS